MFKWVPPLYNIKVSEEVPVVQYGIGAAWYSGHPVSTDYLTNTVSGVLSCKLYTTSGIFLSYHENDYYAAGMLQVVKTTDEDGNISYTYDKFGRIATKKLHGSSTNQLTYAYNVRSWLTGIISGKFSQSLT